MADIVLTTLNAKYIHASFGLRYLYANLGELKDRALIHESTIHERPIDIAETILNHSPTIVGVGVYIWNAVESLKLVKLLKKINPELIVVVGGPEVSYESSAQEIVEIADFTICGEADLTFAKLCGDILKDTKPSQKIIHSPVPKPEELTLPYDCYTEDDIKNRVIYVEASRGCPFTCEFCLSSLDIPVRAFDPDLILPHFEKLLQSGVRQFKFVDRTFNLNIRTSKKILEFFLERYTPGLFVHFEMVPDRLPEGLREIITRFPPGSLQFEVGIQTFNPEVGALISRKQDYAKIAENLSFLRSETGVHVHADLIVGLPGEDIKSFAAGFNRLVELNPQEIQVGILKRLRGTPIVRHDKDWQMTYSSDPPYEVLSTKLIDFKTIQRLSRFSRYWDIVANSGRFIRTLPLMWRESGDPFGEFMAFSDYLFGKIKTRTAIAFDKLTVMLTGYLLDQKRISPHELAELLASDFEKSGATNWPELLPKPTISHQIKNVPDLPERQARHFA